MFSRPVLIFLVALLVASAAAPAQARAADQVVAHDTLIRNIWPLDGDLVYLRAGNPAPARAWMARFHGHVRRARGISARDGAGAIGRDTKNRKIFTFASSRFKSGSLVSSKWFVYDLARNRSRRLRTPATSCPIDWLAIWRDTTAYTTACKDPSKNALFLRRGKHTKRFMRDLGGYVLQFRDGTVASLWEDGNDNVGVAQYAAHGKPCTKIVGAAIGDATDEGGWFPTHLQIVNGYLVWTMGDIFVRRDFAILAAKVRSGCDTPAPIGRFFFKPGIPDVQALSVDNGRVFYADANTLRSQKVSARPSFAAPANDDFGRAQELAGDAPLSAGGNTAHATAQRGEPLGRAGHSVWYAYRPKTNGTVYVTVAPACPNNPPGDACGGSYRTGVYTGSRPDALTKVPMSGGPYTPVYTRVDAVAGQTYWILVSSSFDPNYTPFTVHVDAHPPG